MRSLDRGPVATPTTTPWPIVDGCLRDPRLWRDQKKRPSWMPHRLRDAGPPIFWYRDPGLWLPLSCAITVDSGNVSGPTAGYGAAITWSHNNQGDLLVITLGSANNTWTSVTYPKGGIPTLMTQVGTATQGAFCCAQFFLIGPDTGSNNVVATPTGFDFRDGRACSYSGAATTGQPPESTTNTQPSGGNTTTTVTISVDQSWTMLTAWGNGSGPTAGAGCTLRGTQSGLGHYDSNGGLATGSRSMTVNFSNNGCMVMGSFKPGAAASLGPAFPFPFPIALLGR